MADSIERQRTEREDQSRDLERLATVLRAVLDSTIDGILLTDLDGNVQLANRPLLRFGTELGIPGEGTAIERLLAIKDKMIDQERYVATMERLQAHPEEPSADEFEVVEPYRVFVGYTAPVRDESGALIGRIWTLRDVTQERQLDRLKEEFVATVSHELRTPLTSMMGFLEMLREGEAGQLSAEQDRFLAIVYRSSERLQRLVGDLLFVARLDASGIALQLPRCGWTSSSVPPSRPHRLLARAGGIELGVESSPARGSHVTGRPRADRAARREPDLERAEVHAHRGPRAGAGLRERRARRDRGRGHRHRDPPARAGAPLRAVLPLLVGDRAGDSRHRARARDLAGDRRGARRPDLRRLRAGQGTTFRVELPFVRQFGDAVLAGPA